MSADEDYPELARIVRGVGVEILEDAEDQAERVLAELDRLRSENAALRVADAGMEHHVCRYWEAVHVYDDGTVGIAMSISEDRDARQRVEEWIERFGGYVNGGCQLRCREQRWSSTPATWVDVTEAVLAEAGK